MIFPDRYVFRSLQNIFWREFYLKSWQCTSKSFDVANVCGQQWSLTIQWGGCSFVSYSTKNGQEQTIYYISQALNATEKQYAHHRRSLMFAWYIRLRYTYSLSFVEILNFLIIKQLLHGIYKKFSPLYGLS